MNTIVLLQLQETMAQHGAGKHNQWLGYMTILVVNHGIVKYFRILTAVICLMRKFEVDNPGDSFQQDVKWMLAIR
jgi:hypothetical protein